MKLQLIKYKNAFGYDCWKITKDGLFISVYASYLEAIEAFDKMVERLSQPVEAETVIKEVVI